MGRRTRHNKKSESGLIKLILLLSFTILVLFLWGRVQIDFVLQEIDELNKKKHALLLEIDDLKIQVDALEQFHRIESLAKEQGLVRINRSDYLDLEVNISGLRQVDISNNGQIQIAGLGPTTYLMTESFVSPFEENHAVQ